MKSSIIFAMKTKSLLLSALLLLPLAACQAIPNSEGIPSPTPLATSSALTDLPRPTTISPPSPTSSTATPLSPTEAPSPSLGVTLTSPQDGDIVNTDTIHLRGFAPPETVLSLDDQVFIIGPDGQFDIPVTLEEGPNVIELVASDIWGNETTITLVVTYQP